ncbi:MAG TPA: hypothetical protein V6D22_00470 [Candidatus Obscuribacterales bacterium]
MKSLKDELAKVLNAKDEAAAAEAFQKFCAKHGTALPLPGEDRQFDKAMWAAAEYAKLSKKDEGILRRVTGKLLGEQQADVVGAAVLKLKDLVGQSKEAAIGTWQDMLSAMAWQQMVPAGALRGVGTQMVSLGTFAKTVDDADVQVNIGWMVDKDQLRVLLQAKDSSDEALPDVELRIKEAGGKVVYSRMTNEDGAVVAPNVQVGPGRYRIEVVRNDKVAETPYFEV